MSISRCIAPVHVAICVSIFLLREIQISVYRHFLLSLFLLLKVILSSRLVSSKAAKNNPANFYCGVVKRHFYDKGIIFYSHSKVDLSHKILVVVSCGIECLTFFLKR